MVVLDATGNYNDGNNRLTSAVSWRSRREARYMVVLDATGNCNNGNNRLTSAVSWRSRREARYMATTCSDSPLMLQGGG